MSVGLVDLVIQSQKELAKQGIVFKMPDFLADLLQGMTNPFEAWETIAKAYEGQYWQVNIPKKPDVKKPNYYDINRKGNEMRLPTFETVITQIDWSKVKQDLAWKIDPLTGRYYKAYSNEVYFFNLLKTLYGTPKNHLEYQKMLDLARRLSRYYENVVLKGGKIPTKPTIPSKPSIPPPKTPRKPPKRSEEEAKEEIPYPPLPFLPNLTPEIPKPEDIFQNFLKGLQDFFAPIGAQAQSTLAILVPYIIIFIVIVVLLKVIF